MRRSLVTLVVALLAGLVGAREARTDDLFVAGLGGKDSGNDCRAAATPCKTIEWAVSQAGSGDAIKVAGGTYRDYLRIEESTTLTFSGGWASGFATRDPALNRTTVVPGVNPHSGGRRSTQVIIRGSGHEPTHDIIDLTIDGFTLKRGKTGAVEISGQDQSSVVVRFVGTDFIRNRTGSYFPGATVSIGAKGESSVSATFSRCRFVKNTGLYVGGGISVRGSEDSTVAVALTNSVIADNRTRARVLNAGAAGMDISVVGETAQVTVDLTNSTITRNRSRGRHAGLWFGLSGGEMITLNLKNVILWGNLPRFEGQGGDLAEGDDLPAGKLTVNADHSDLGDVRIERNTFNDLGGNLSVEPLFREPNDIHLAASSPLIDTGTNDGAPAVDFEGDPRPADGDGDSQAITDIGADELVP